MTDGWTRRRFVQWVGTGAGIGGAYATLTALGLTPPTTAVAGLPAIPAMVGRGRRVAVLGAGIAGLVAAYELGRHGFDCTVLEARPVTGGRIRTVRGGDVIGSGPELQRADWPDRSDLYFNSGAARISHLHVAVLHYCREFTIPLQVFINENRNAWLGAASGGRVRLNQVVADTRGHVAELLARAVDRRALDAHLGAADRERLADLLRLFGALGDDLFYRGSRRSTYARLPGAGLDDGTIVPPLPLGGLLDTPWWQEAAWFTELAAQAGPMLEPVGGMDRIPAAFAVRLPPIRTNATCRSLQREGGRARVVWRGAGGEVLSDLFDFAVVTLPLPILAELPADFAPGWREAIAAARTIPAVKAAFHSPRRFWEEDDSIYGGVSWTDADITQLWYPSSNFHGDGGIVVGAYAWSDEAGNRLSDLPPVERLAAIRAAGRHLHPDVPEEVGAGVSVAWRNDPFARGAWVDWTPGDRRDLLPRLTLPDWPYVLAGDAISALPGWQEGAVLAAHEAVRQIVARVAG